MKHRYTRPLAIAVLLALISAVIVLTKPTASVKAQTGGMPTAPMPPSDTNVSPPVVTGVNHVLKETYIHTCLPNCNGFAMKSGVYIALDPWTEINCPAPVGKTCTITDDVSISLENTSTTTNNPAALIFYIDGSFQEDYLAGGGGTPGGPYPDAIAQKSAVIARVSPGTHTVQTRTFSLYGAMGQTRTTTYRVYVP